MTSPLAMLLAILLSETESRLATCKSAIGNRQLAMIQSAMTLFLLPFFLFRLPFFLFWLGRFFVFLLALANELWLGGCFFFGDRRFNYFFLHEADRSNNGFRRR